MKKIYFARRIQKNPETKLILKLIEGMSPQDIHNSYVQKEEIYDEYIHNGHWILRPPLSESIFSVNNLPEDLTALHVWKMVKSKIEKSSVFVGIINSRSYGTIGEIGYACKCKNMAVYVLPDENVVQAELEDLWFIFHMARTTSRHWSETDIKIISEFQSFGINSIEDYISFIDKIVPPFLKK